MISDCEEKKEMSRVCACETRLPCACYSEAMRMTRFDQCFACGKYFPGMVPVPGAAKKGEDLKGSIDVG